METGEDKLIRETCWTRLVTTEKVTVTEREKLNGVTETCTRHEVTKAIEKLKGSQEETKEGLKVVTVECEKRLQDMTKGVDKLGLEVKTETEELAGWLSSAACGCWLHHWLGRGFCR